MHTVYNTSKCLYFPPSSAPLTLLQTSYFHCRMHPSTSQSRHLQCVLVTREGNYCQDAACVLSTARALSVPIDKSFVYLPLSAEAIQWVHTTPKRERHTYTHLTHSLTHSHTPIHAYTHTHTYIYTHIHTHNIAAALESAQAIALLRILLHRQRTFPRPPIHRCSGDIPVPVPLRPGYPLQGRAGHHPQYFRRGGGQLGVHSQVLHRVHSPSIHQPG